MSDQRFNTGNPIGSNSPLDRSDNTRNLDLVVNSDGDTFQDRLGKSRLTWTGIEKAGTGDTGVAIDAASRAVEAAGQAGNEADRAAGAASRAENAEAVVDAANIKAEIDRAEAARDAAFVNADVYPDIATGRAAVADGEQFQVLSDDGHEYVRYRRDSSSTQTVVARYPRSGFSIANARIYASATGIKVNSSTKTITFSSGGRIAVGTRMVLIDEDKVLNYAAAVGITAYLFYDPTSNSFGFRDPGQPLPQNAAVFCAVTVASGRLFGAGVGAYLLNGVRVTAGERNLPITGRLYGYAGSVVVNAANKTISISRNPRVVASVGGSFNVPNQQISYENTYGNEVYYLVANAATRDLSLKNVSSVFGIPDDEDLGSLIVVLGHMVPDEGVIWGLDLREVSERSVTFGQYLGEPSGVKINSETKTLTVAGRVFFQDGTNVLSNSSTSFDGLVTNPHVVVMDRTSGGIRLVRTPLHEDILPSESIIGSFYPRTETLSGFPNGYALNGIEVDMPVTGDPVVPRIPEIGWDLPGVYDAPPMPGYLPSSAIPMATVDSFMIQSWFDGLVSDHPEYVTRTHLGDTATGLPVYAYRFKPDMGGSSVQPRVMIQGAIHSEWMTYVLPFHVMDLIANNWEDDPILEAFRWGLDITVIPVVNPYGVNNNQRHNSNGVDLNRNYPTFWKSGETHGSTFLSELETQYSFQIMKEFKPHIMLDMHNFHTQTSGPTEGAFLWFPAFTQGTRRAGQSMINRMARKWKDEHPWMPPASVIDRAVTMDPILATSAATAIAMGAEAITFETGDRLLGEPGTSSRYSELTVKCGVEAVINYLMILLRR